jgi:DNA-binding HxlR family transcriptional regulator
MKLWRQRASRLTVHLGDEEGIQCLRRLERNGLVERRVITAAPLGVEYAFTELGRTLDERPGAAIAIQNWLKSHFKLQI